MVIEHLSADTIQLRIIGESNKPVKFASVVLSESKQLFSSDDSGIVSIPEKQIGYNDKFMIIALGYERLHITQEELDQARLTVQLIEKPIYLKPFVFEAGQCDELAVGAEDQRAYPVSYVEFMERIGMEMTKPDGFIGKTFTGIDYFIPNVSRNKEGSPFRLIIYNLSDGLPDSIVYRSGLIDDYSVKWYHFLRGGTWNSYEFLDTLVTVPEGGFMLVIERRADYNWEKAREQYSKGERPDDLPGPVLARINEFSGPTTWNYDKTNLFHRMSENIVSIIWQEDRYSPEYMWYKSNIFDTPSKHNQNNGTEYDGNYLGLMLLARYSACSH